MAHVRGGRACRSTCRIRVEEGLDALTTRTEKKQLMAATRISHTVLGTAPVMLSRRHMKR